ncbi:hypothetical protein [Streptomyces amakusaensis]|uniref:Leucine-rich repeat domain-containing protein n=1 Tax=Streptomyces amakusaensis TaxID=67271 RepID=A0ABW0ABM6_9ACTN
MRIDPAVDQAIRRAVGHGLPVTEEERESVDSLNLRNAKEITDLGLFTSLQRLIITGSDPVSVGHFSMIEGLRTLTLEDSGFSDLSGIESLSLLSLAIPRNWVTDISPVLNMSTLLQIDVTGNPLSEHSWRHVIPAMRDSGCRVKASGELEWRLTVHLHSAGVRISCYKNSEDYRLCRPGLGLTDLPQYAHPIVSLEDVRELLAGDPSAAHRYFEGRPRLV